MAKQNSSKWKMLAATIAIDNLLDLKLEINNKLIDVTDKDSAGWEEFLGGLKGGSFSASANVDFGDSGVTPDEVFTALVAGNAVAFELTTAVASDKRYTFNGLYDKWDIGGGVEDKITYNFSGRITGVVTQANIP